MRWIPQGLEVWVKIDVCMWPYECKVGPMYN